MAEYILMPAKRCGGFADRNRWPYVHRLPGLWLLTAVVLAAGCASVPEYKQPTVSVTSLRMLPTGTMTPRFEIGLHIVNPNRKPLELKGIAYTVYLEDHKILTGASNKLPSIEAYGQGEVRLQGVTNVIGGISLISDLIKRPRSEYGYKLEASLDPGGNKPEFNIVDEGSIDLGS